MIIFIKNNFLKMKINSKKEKKYSTEVENNDQQNDSIFQEEGGGK